MPRQAARLRSRSVDFIEVQEAEDKVVPRAGLRLLIPTKLIPDAFLFRFKHLLYRPAYARLPESMEDIHGEMKSPDEVAFHLVKLFLT